MLLSVLLFFVWAKMFAADSTILYNRRNLLFIEAGGKGPYYSVNYGRIFRQDKKLVYCWRAGFLLLPKDLSVPLALDAFTNGREHHFETSLGITFYLKDYKTFLHKNDLSDKQFYITPAIGYRFQKMNSSFFLCVGIDPLIFMDPPSGNLWNFEPGLIVSGHLALGFLF